MEKREFPISFGNWVKGRRKALDLTQEELALRAGCSVFALRKIESGERRPSKQLAGLLATALEVQEEDTLTFVRVARGELNLERLRAFVLDSSTASLLDYQPASHHLPLPPTPLLGRDRELAALERIFSDPQCRLLTLTGIGGIGKTRLAIEFATCQQSMFPGGVYYVPLASVDSAELIIPEIAEALGFSFSGPHNPRDQLIKYLSGGMKHSMLLVLDNLEHLIVQSSAAVDLVSEILQKLTNVKILTTSRERLNLHGEWMYELHGLPVPPVEFIDKLDDYSAVTLFIQCARRIKTDFEIADDEKPALVRICHLLEGIPLAIELAAAWVELLSCEEIAQEIESNIGFLETSVRDIPKRHRSLRASFDHSWKLLTDAERDALCRLAIFHGGFDRRAAEQVVGATLPLLASLVSKSLVRRAEDGRYDLHEVIRQFAMSCLDADPSRCFETRNVHSEYYLRFAADRERALKSAPQQHVAREMIDEMDNLRAAWAWAIERKNFATLGPSVRSLGWFFEVSGFVHEGIEHFEPLVQTLKAKHQNHEWQWILGQALTQQGMLCFRKGHFDRAQALMEESLSVLRPLGKQTLLVDSLVYLGVIMHLNGDLDYSRALMEEGLVCARSTANKWFEAYAIYNLGYLDSLSGRYVEGREQMLDGICIWRELGDPHSIALGLNYLGPTLVKLGCYEEAETSLQESLMLCKTSGNRWGMGTAYRYLGLVKMAQRNIEDAQSLFHKSLETFGEYIVGWDIARSYTFLADATLMAGDASEAKKIYLQALRLAKEASSIPLILDALVGLAQFALQTGAHERALELSDFVLQHVASVQVTKECARQIGLDAEKFLDREQVCEIEKRTADQSLEDIVNLALLG
jgi:predicted ATPase/DNA-binding XRE family transcriptional regulator